MENDHYGLDKVKDRILEYLAVQKRTEKIKGPILCLVGPPGVGKTSLGKSIASATGRNFVRMSLGELEMRLRLGASKDIHRFNAWKIYSINEEG